MNFNIYINDQLYRELENSKELLGKSRNSIVREALVEWVSRHKQTKWPKNFFKFDDVLRELYPDAKELREGIIEPKKLSF